MTRCVSLRVDAHQRLLRQDRAHRGSLCHKGGLKIAGHRLLSYVRHDTRHCRLGRGWFSDNQSEETLSVYIETASPGVPWVRHGRRIDSLGGCPMELSENCVPRLLATGLLFILRNECIGYPAQEQRDTCILSDNLLLCSQTLKPNRRASNDAETHDVVQCRHDRRG